MKVMQSSVTSGISTDQLQIKTAGVHSVFVRTTVDAPSGIVITISQSGSVTRSVTTPTTSPVTADIQLNGQFNCAVGDLLTVAVTSSATHDQPPNLIKTIITVKQGV